MTLINVKKPNPPTCIKQIIISCPISEYCSQTTTGTSPVTQVAEVAIKRLSRYVADGPLLDNGKHKSNDPITITAKKLNAILRVGENNLRL